MSHQSNLNPNQSLESAANSAVDQISSQQQQQQSNHLIKKFSLFDTTQSKQVVDSVIEVLDLAFAIDQQQPDNEKSSNSDTFDSSIFPIYSA
jgi:hypothetical protein